VQESSCTTRLAQCLLHHKPYRADHPRLENASSNSCAPVRYHGSCPSCPCGQVTSILGCRNEQGNRFLWTGDRADSINLRLALPTLDLQIREFGIRAVLCQSSSTNVSRKSHRVRRLASRAKQLSKASRHIKAVNPPAPPRRHSENARCPDWLPRRVCIIETGPDRHVHRLAQLDSNC